MKDEDTVFIMDSSIFQYQIFTYLLKSAGYDRLSVFVQKIMAYLDVLNPLLIYLYRENTGDSIAYLRDQRGIDDLEHTWERDKDEPYYTNKQKDVSAFYDFLNDYADHAVRLFDVIKCDKKKINIAENDWEAYEDEMLKLLNIDRKEAPDHKVVSGTYANSEYGISFSIEDNEMNDPEGVRRRLIPKSQKEFFVEGLPTILEFFDEKHIRINGQQIIPQWTETGMVYERVRPSLMECTKNRFAGISFAYIDPAGKITTEYSGTADRESNIPVDEDTVFPACSISKFVTAICVMKACEQDLINIDSPVNAYLRRWKLLTVDGSESDASIRALLCHSAGIIDGEDGFYGLRRNDTIVSLTDILDGKTTYNNRPACTEKTPWTEFEYSDAGYCVLQMLLEDITQKQFEDLAGEIIFAPLNLNRTFFASLKNIEAYEKKYVLATGYDENDIPIPGKYPQVPDLAASGLWSTPKELLMIAREFFMAYNGKSSLLNENSAREMAKPSEQFSWVGLGVFMGAENEIVSRGWGENGQSMLRINYVTGEAAVVMTNRNPGVDQAESGLEAIVNGKRQEV